MIASTIINLLGSNTTLVKKSKVEFTIYCNKKKKWSITSLNLEYFVHKKITQPLDMALHKRSIHDSNQHNPLLGSNKTFEKKSMT
jgi:hypothetical protein